MGVFKRSSDTIVLKQETGSSCYVWTTLNIHRWSFSFASVYECRVQHPQSFLARSPVERAPFLLSAPWLGKKNKKAFLNINRKQKVLSNQRIRNESNTTAVVLKRWNSNVYQPPPRNTRNILSEVRCFQIIGRLTQHYEIFSSIDIIERVSIIGTRLHDTEVSTPKREDFTPHEGFHVTWGRPGGGGDLQKRLPWALATEGGLVTRSADTHSSIRRLSPW